MSVFLGTYINKVDRKGRVSVPAAFRTVLAKAGSGQIAVFPSYNFKAIDGHGPETLAALAQSTFADYSVYAPSPSNLATQIFELAHQLDWDAEGRVGLPEELLAHAGIAEQAAFVGKGGFFQIWAPDALAQQRAADKAAIAKAPPQINLRPKEGP